MHMQLPYSAQFWQGKTLANQLFQGFGEEELAINNSFLVNLAG